MKKYRIGLAVSGGADSVALLVLMAGLRREHGFEAVVLHVDHGLRRDSADDAAFVEKLARRFGLECRSLRTVVKPGKGESVEMAARNVRLEFFAQMTTELKLDAVATGHHMDDVAETFIMRLKRASGADGLAGLKPISRVKGITFIRPLLNQRSEALREFLRSRGIAWREDSTNSDTTILRNKVRHVILPFLKKELDPKIVEHICRSAEYLRQSAIGDANAGAKSRLSGAVSGEQAAIAAEPSARHELTVSPSSGFEIFAEDIGRLPASAWMSASAVKGRTLEVRTWRNGDWMRPCGFGHRRKLQDIFVTAKTPPRIRHALPLVADADSGEVLWIPGYRISESVKVESPDSASVKLVLSAV